MKRKLIILFCFLLMLLSLGGCAGSKADTLEYDEQAIGQFLDVFIAYCSETDAAEKEQLTSQTEFALQYQFMNSGLPMTPESFQGAVKSWNAGVEECGSYLGHGDYVYEPGRKNLKVSVSAQFENRNAELLFVFDKEVYLESMTVNAEYGTGEILKKAGMNTLLGMGTVFAVLILISFVISLFRFIPGIEQALRGKNSDIVKEPETGSQPTAGAVQTSQAGSDTELIAVITAAITAARESQGIQSTDGFVVRSVKRRTSNKW